MYVAPYRTVPHQLHLPPHPVVTMSAAPCRTNCSPHRACRPPCCAQRPTTSIPAAGWRPSAPHAACPAPAVPVSHARARSSWPCRHWTTTPGRCWWSAPCKGDSCCRVLGYVGCTAGGQPTFCKGTPVWGRDGGAAAQRCTSSQYWPPCPLLRALSCSDPPPHPFPACSGCSEPGLHGGAAEGGHAGGVQDVPVRRHAGAPCGRVAAAGRPGVHGAPWAVRHRSVLGKHRLAGRARSHQGWRGFRTKEFTRQDCPALMCHAEMMPPPPSTADPLSALSPLAEPPECCEGVEGGVGS